MTDPEGTGSDGQLQLRKCSCRADGLRRREKPSCDVRLESVVRPTLRRCQGPSLVTSDAVQASGLGRVPSAARKGPSRLQSEDIR